ncbi:hypothetical protein BD410DRAFT_590391 [Rickenella mellea]|uniref:Uncharacterized protein n=1 Tax=Rickenella mellea TaxID=50990 RepID=A0A4Y7PPC6_9AGAM|nr:hypothetical protein BD410DRAFT_590391 [Rickenella mellea]
MFLLHIVRRRKISLRDAVLDSNGTVLVGLFVSAEYNDRTNGLRTIFKLGSEVGNVYPINWRQSHFSKRRLRSSAHSLGYYSTCFAFSPPSPRSVNIPSSFGTSYRSSWSRILLMAAAILFTRLRLLPWIHPSSYMALKIAQHHARQPLRCSFIS